MILLVLALPGCGGFVRGITDQIRMANASPTPYPSPLLTPSASTDKAVVTGFGAAKAVTFTASQANYTATIGESDTCAPALGTVATITPANAVGPNVTYTVTGVASGTCGITLTTPGNTVVIFASVSGP